MACSFVAAAAFAAFISAAFAASAAFGVCGHDALGVCGREGDFPLPLGVCGRDTGGEGPIILGPGTCVDARGVI